MSFSTVVSLVLSAIAIGVTVTLFVLTRREAKRSSERALKARVVDLLLDAMERAVHLHGQPALVRAWRDPQVEVALLVPRLLSELGPRYAAVQQWAISEIAATARVVRRREVLTIQVNMTMKLIEWQQELIPDSWFREKVAHGPDAISLAVTPRIKRARGWLLSAQMLGEALGVGAITAATGRVWRSF